MNYVGMSYEQASQEALRLIRQAAKTGDWRELPQRLTALRAQMDIQLARGPSWEGWPMMAERLD